MSSERLDLFEKACCRFAVVLWKYSSASSCSFIYMYVYSCAIHRRTKILYFSHPAGSIDYDVIDSKLIEDGTP